MERIAKIKITNADKSVNSPLEITAYCDDENFEKALWFREIKNARIIWEEEDNWEYNMLKKEKEKLQKSLKETNKKISKIDKKMKELK